MGEFLPRLVFFLVACLAVGMVNGASRASTLDGVLRETLRSFVALTGGIVLLCAAAHLLLLVTQSP